LWVAASERCILKYALRTVDYYHENVLVMIKESREQLYPLKESALPLLEMMYLLILAGRAAP